MIPDEELYRRWLSGDEEGLRALMERYGDRLTLSGISTRGRIS